MSSAAAVCCLSARITARSVRRKAATRAFSRSAAPCAAQNFNLPSLSPTMTEGGIANWKVKEGDSFAAGDVLLEIETDKAQMDVEAQDDGKVFKIFEQDGAKGIKVGTRIGVLAGPDDDLSSLEVPSEDNASSPKSEEKGKASVSSSDAPSQKKEEKTETKESSTSSTSSSSSSSSSTSSPPSEQQESKPTTSSTSYPFYPSVQYLLHTLKVSSSDAAKIKATGPNGRLLKGDVLAHLGKIEKSYSADQSKRITKLGHLDLSNIKKAAPPKKETVASAAAAAATSSEPEPPTEIALPISLSAVFATQKRIQDSLGLHLPLSTFIARASEIANEALPRAANAAGPSADDLFDAVLGLDKLSRTKTTKGRYIPQITALPPSSSPLFRSNNKPKKPADIFDILSGAPSAKKTPSVIPGAIGVASGTSGASNVFSVAAKKGEEKRVRVYLERVKEVLEVEPGRCVL